jgi:hypothetical protein
LNQTKNQMENTMGTTIQNKKNRGGVCHYTYLTDDGDGYFKFEFYPVDDGFEIDIVSKPKCLKTRKKVHKYFLETSPRNGRQQIIPHSHKLPTSLKRACHHAEAWAELIWSARLKCKNQRPYPGSEKKSSKKQDSVKSKKQTYTHVKNEKLQMVFTSDAFGEIKSSVGSKKPETGGILLGFRSDYVVQKFIFDKEGSFSPSGYDPNVDYLNPFLKSEWHENRYELIGFVHSHPRGVCRLSGDWGNGIGDLGYLKRIFEHINGLNKFLVPIVYSVFDNHPFEIFPFIAWKASVKNYKKGAVKILNEKNSINN